MFGGRQPRQTLKINTYPGRRQYCETHYAPILSHQSTESVEKVLLQRPKRTVAPIRPTAVLWSKYLPDVEENFPVVLARGEGGVTALVPGGAPTAIFGDPLPPANHGNTKTNEHVITLLNSRRPTHREVVLFLAKSRTFVCAMSVHARNG